MLDKIVLHKGLKIPSLQMDSLEGAIASKFRPFYNIPTGYHAIAASLVRQLRTRSSFRDAVAEHRLESFPIEILVLMTNQAINGMDPKARENLFEYIKSDAPPNFPFLCTNRGSELEIPIIKAIRCEDPDLVKVLATKFQYYENIFAVYEGFGADIPSIFSAAMISPNPALVLALFEGMNCREPSKILKGRIGPVQCANADSEELLHNIANNLVAIRNYEQGVAEAIQREAPIKSVLGRLGTRLAGLLKS